MNNSTQEKNENPVVTLKAQAEKFDFSKLRAPRDNKEANSGEAIYKDFDRMDFVIKDRNIDKILIKALVNRNKEGFDKIWEEYCEDPEIPSDKKTDQYKEEIKRFYDLGKEHTHLLPKEGDKNKSYRAFAKEVFKEIFEYANAQVPSDSILEELVTNCNQAGYEAGVFIESQFALSQHSLKILSPKKVINIYYVDQNNVSVRSDMTLPILSQESDVQLGDKVCDLSSSLEFTLESQDGKDDVIYKDGKLSLTVPRKLRDYKIDGRSLFDTIKEYFYKFCEKLGFKFEVEIEHNFEGEDSLYEGEEYNFEGERLVFQEQPQNYIEDPDVDPLNKKREISP
ncbi:MULTISPECIES: hypothetical protein [Wolbachia]|uniref:hypothetical protein n=1 Tax=Wolbachia TaxID=953 RepID=UPI001E3B065F|nr:MULTISPECIES: hypothetical protein [unclassified Wolbachia]UFO00831.1 hypothetical protein LOK48_02520 [Wolbachia endosymbiont of Corcyra cephalonica]